MTTDKNSPDTTSPRKRNTTPPRGVPAAESAVEPTNSFPSPPVAIAAEKRGAIVDTASIFCITAFAITALCTQHEAAAVGAVMLIPQILGVRSALRAVQTNAGVAASAVAGHSGVLVLLASLGTGVARMVGKA